MHILTTESSWVTNGFSFSEGTVENALGVVNNFCSVFVVRCLVLTAGETVESLIFIFGIVSTTSFDCCS